MIIVVLLCIGILVAAYFHFRRKPKKRKLAQPVDTPEFRVAIHESGHAIAAWFCTAVTGIDSVTMESIHKGFLAYRFCNNHPDVAWCNLVIALAGMAAEVHIYQSVRSGPAAGDLVEARKLATHLVNIDRTQFPWKLDESITSLPFEKMFTDQLPEQENQVLQLGYCFAKQLIEERSEYHHRLVVELLKERELLETQLYPILGERFFMKALRLFRPNFI